MALGLFSIMGIFSDIAAEITGSMDDAVELVYYTANGAAEISFSTHVFRNSLSAADAQRGPAQLNNDIRVYIPVAYVPTITLQKDSVRIKRNMGDTAYTAFSVMKIEKQDAGSFTVRVA
jgi:hypothetical protein